MRNLLMKTKIDNKYLKSIMHSKRANIFYLEKCRVMQKDGRVLYLTDTEKANMYWNIPIANTTVIILGTGTSITQAAVRLLTSAGVIIGFSGGGGTPILSGNEVEWFTPVNEYRPTEYVQKWCKFWFDEIKRFEIAKQFQNKRCEYLVKYWQKDLQLQKYGFYIDDIEIENTIKSFQTKIQNAKDVTNLLAAEAVFTKALYKYAASRTNNEGFVREQKGDDLANSFLDHGNYLAYGIAATTIWVLGIPHGFPVLHGKTRRGALVFDVADLVKDTVVLPYAFIAADSGMKTQEFRQLIIQKFIDNKSMDFMFDTIENICDSIE